MYKNPLGENMKRTMIYLPDDTHRGLKKLAFEADSSIAELIRKAVDALYGEDIEDIQVMEEEIAKYRANPESAIGLDELRRRKKVKGRF
jgi:predicted DNA-binding protein